MFTWRAISGWRCFVLIAAGSLGAAVCAPPAGAEPDWRRPSLDEFRFFDDTGADKEAEFYKRFYRALRIEQTDIAGAREIYEALLKERPGTAYLYYKLAHLDAREQDLESCVDNFKAAIEHDPTLRAAYDDLERLYTFWRRDDELVELWEQAIEHIKPNNIAYYLKLGEHQRRHDRIAEAIDVYQRAIAEHPTVYQPWLRLFEIQLDLGDKEKAYETFQKALEATGGHRGLLDGVRERYLEKGDADRAFELTELLVKRFPSNADYWHDYIEELLQRDQVEEARDAFKKSCAYVAKEKGYFAGIVRLYAGRADPDEAIRIYKYALEWDPDAPEVLVALALMYQAKGQMDKAQPLYDRLLESGPRNEALLLAIAEGYEDQGDLEAFGEWAGRAMAINPEAFQTRFAMVRYFERSGKTKEARALLDEVLDDVLAGDHPDVAPLTQVGRFYLAMREYDLVRDIAGKGLGSTGYRPLVREFYYLSGLADYFQNRVPDAARKLKIASRRRGEFPFAHFYLGMADLRLGEPGLAVDALEKAVEADPDDAYWKLKLGQALKQADRSGEATHLFDAAIAALRQSAEAQPDDADKKIELASALGEVGRYEEAVRVYKEAVGVDPQSAPALNNLAYLMAEHNADLDEALDLVKRALELEPDSGIYIDTLGWIYYQQGKYKDAVRELERAAALGPPNGAICDHVGDAYLKLDDKTKAIEWWNKALDLYPDNAAEIRKKITDQGGTAAAE